MNSLAGSTFLLNFQIPMALMPGELWLPGRPGRRGVMVDVVGDRHLLLQRGVVRADGVVNPRVLAGEDAAVVGGVVPGEDLGLHRVPVGFLVPLDGRRGLVGDDGRRLAVGLQHLAAEAPQHRPEGGVGVARVADGDADRVALLLEHLALLEQLVPGLRRLQPGLPEVRHVVGGGKRDPVPRHRPPPRVGLRGLGGERIPAAVLLAERVDERADVDELVLEQERIGMAQEDQVVAGLRLRLGRALGRQLQPGDGIHPHGDPRLLAEHLRLPPQLVVRGRHEMVVAQERQLPLLRPAPAPDRARAPPPPPAAVTRSPDASSVRS